MFDRFDSAWGALMPDNSFATDVRSADSARRLSASRVQRSSS